MSNHTASVTKVDRLTVDVEVRFEEFEDLPARNGVDCTHSPVFNCFGHEWHLNLWPGGDSTESKGVGVYLYHESRASIEIMPTFIVKDPEGMTVTEYALETNAFSCPAGGTDIPQLYSWGVTGLVKRSTAIDALDDDGALILQVRMVKPALFVPSNPLGKNILKKFMDEESANVVFGVCKEQIEGGCKEGKNSAKFHAHELILEGNAPALAEACKLRNGLDPIPISGIDPAIFRKVLYYVYGGKLEDECMEANAKDIIEAADKLGVVNLKLEAEARYVESDPINFENVLDNIAYADAMSCPLLKEAAMDFLVQNGSEAVQKLSFTDVPGEVIADLLTAINTGVNARAGESGEEWNTMRISELRRKLDEKGLDVDGSREAMISALQDCSVESDEET